jgi:uncharacterized iron-regulated membrane protein
MVRTWTSLISTVFLLLLCLTGLPLIFHHEIDEILGYAPQPEAHAGAVRATTQQVADAALAADPGRVLQYISFDKDEPGIVMAFTNGAPDSPPDKATLRAFDAVTVRLLGPVGVGPMLIVLKLHTDMFAGQAGKLFLGAMGLMFAVAIISGLVLYWPFMRRLRFAIIRDSAARRVVWFDWHNLIGVVTVVWALVVGLTGVINTWAKLMLDQWKATELASMVGPYAGKPQPVHLASLDGVVDRAKAVAPGMDIAFIAFPGTPFTSSHHFAVFMRGDTTLTARLLKPVLLDGETGEVADSRTLPVYLQALLISQPLHFGDYGGMPLKVIWAALDVLTLIVIGSGLYLWLSRRQSGAPPAPTHSRSEPQSRHDAWLAPALAPVDKGVRRADSDCRGDRDRAARGAAVGRDRQICRLGDGRLSCARHPLGLAASQQDSKAILDTPRGGPACFARSVR